MGVTAVSATDIWAVGTVESAGSGYQTLIEHWNGSTWQIVPSPSPGSFYNFLQGITAVSATDLWAVGYYQPGYTDQPLLLHWDGHTWSQVRAGQSTVSRHRLEAAVSATNVWTVGTIGPTDAQQTLTLHWNGQQWQPVSSPSPAAYSNALHSVIALGPSNVWAAGDTNDQSSGAALFVHWGRHRVEPGAQPRRGPDRKPGRRRGERSLGGRPYVGREFPANADPALGRDRMDGGR